MRSPSRTMGIRVCRCDARRGGGCGASPTLPRPPPPPAAPAASQGTLAAPPSMPSRATCLLAAPSPTSCPSAVHRVDGKGSGVESGADSCTPPASLAAHSRSSLLPTGQPTLPATRRGRMPVQKSPHRKTFPWSAWLQRGLGNKYRRQTLLPAQQGEIPEDAHPAQPPKPPFPSICPPRGKGCAPH